MESVARAASFGITPAFLLTAEGAFEKGGVAWRLPLECSLPASGLKKR
jgi:hypothetical protein